MLSVRLLVVKFGRVKVTGRFSAALGVSVPNCPCSNVNCISFVFWFHSMFYCTWILAFLTFKGLGKLQWDFIWLKWSKSENSLWKQKGQKGWEAGPGGCLRFGLEDWQNRADGGCDHTVLTMFQLSLCSLKSQDTQVFCTAWLPDEELQRQKRLAVYGVGWSTRSGSVAASEDSPDN